MDESSLEDDHRKLVRLLMQHGWYRVGQGPAHDPDRIMWGFREGHLLDDPASPILWIPARDELSAMQVLLREIEDLPGGGRVRDAQDAKLRLLPSKGAQKGSEPGIKLAGSGTEWLTLR
jgi:hypothetical protein